MSLLLRFLRVIALVAGAVLGTALMVVAAPGYFSDVREMDAAHGQAARAELHELRQEQGSVPHLLRTEFSGWIRGDFGVSRQYRTPVSGLIRERCQTSLQLLFMGVLLGWSSALLVAIPISMSRSSVIALLTALATALLLAIPVSLLATLCLLSSIGGPVFTLACMVAIRDFKLLHKAVQTTWSAPHILHARASGVSSLPILRSHMLVSLQRELGAIVVISFTLALSALVPVEVVFDSAGLGQLAWAAAMNRDLPVLAAVTALMAACVGLAGMLADRSTHKEATACA